MLSSAAILYVSYDGMLEPLGQSQVLAYLERLSGDADISLLSFEKPEDLADQVRVDAMTERMRRAGISWTKLRYHRRPTAPATLYDVARGMVVALWLTLRHRVRVLHTRSYVAMLIATPVAKLTGAKLLFDMRGFWADERVDGGLWSADGRLYRIAKRLERSFLLASDHVVSLTMAAVEVMRHFPYLADRTPPMSVIPTCADVDRFTPAPSGPPDGFAVGFVGSAGTWYLFDEMLAAFAAIKRLRPDARLTIVNRGEHDFIRMRAAAAGIATTDYDLFAVDHSDMPHVIRRLNACILLIKPAFSKIASAPTKLGELLGCGIPCLVNDRVGDMEAIVSGERIGVVLTAFTEVAYDEAARALIALAAEPGIVERCAEAARRHFSLDEGVTQYREIYRSLSEAFASAIPNRLR